MKTPRIIPSCDLNIQHWSRRWFNFAFPMQPSTGAPRFLIKLQALQKVAHWRFWPDQIIWGIQKPAGHWDRYLILRYSQPAPCGLFCGATSFKDPRNEGAKSFPVGLHQLPQRHGWLGFPAYSTAIAALPSRVYWVVNLMICHQGTRKKYEVTICPVWFKVDRMKSKQTLDGWIENPWQHAIFWKCGVFVSQLESIAVGTEHHYVFHYV